MKLLSLLDRHDAMCGRHELLATVRHQLDLIAQHHRITRGTLRTQLLRVARELKRLDRRLAGFDVPAVDEFREALAAV